MAAGALSAFSFLIYVFLDGLGRILRVFMYS